MHAHGIITIDQAQEIMDHPDTACALVVNSVDVELVPVIGELDDPDDQEFNVQSQFAAYIVSDDVELAEVG